MTRGNFTEIAGFNEAPRRERPVLRALALGALLGGALTAVWETAPYAFVLLDVLR